MRRLQCAHFSSTVGTDRDSVSVWRRQLAQVAIVRIKGGIPPTPVVTSRISPRLTEQAKAKQASHKGSPGHCSSNFRTVSDRSVPGL